MSLIHGWLELVLPHCFDGFFVQPHAQMLDKLNVLRISLRIDNKPDRDDPLKVCSTCIFGEFRLD